MAEEFSGIGSTFYVGLPGQSVEEMQEMKLQHSEQYFYKLDDIGTQDVSPSYGKRKYYPLTFEIVDDHSFERTKLYHFMQQHRDDHSRNHLL